MSSEKNGKNLEYMSMEESQEVMVKGNAYEKGRGRKPPTPGARGWLRRRTTMEKFLLLLLFILIIVCIVLLICIIVTAASSLTNVDVDGKTGSPLKTEGVCVTPECVMAAGTILSSMDLTAEPCDDFYQFACGGWTEKNHIPDEESKYSVFDEAHNHLMEVSRGMLEERNSSDSEAMSKVKEFYAACTNEELIEQYGAQPLLDMIEDLGGWPVIEGSSWDEASWDFIEVLAKNAMETNYNFLFAHSVTADIVNLDTYITIIDQPELALREKSYYFEETAEKKRTAYLTYMVDIATALRPDHNRLEAQRQMEETLEFEIALANFSVSPTEKRDLRKINNRYKIARLQTEMPQIDWLRYFRLMHGDDISPDAEVLNFSPGYIEKLAVHIGTTTKRTIANYLVWRVVAYMNEYLNTEMRDIRQQFRWVTRGERSERSRWKICFDNANLFFGMAMGARYVREHFDQDRKAAAQEMVNDIRDTLIDTLNKVPWMDERTRAHAVRKASKIRERIGYADILMDEEAVNDVYKTIEMSPNKYFENVRAIWRDDAKKEMRKYGKQVESDEWKQESVITINAFYHTVNNEIIFPAGIFQPPFYSGHFPKAMNYGGIGMVIGHELMHGFDDKGRHYDEDGNMQQWFSNSSIQAYEERTKCFIHQYSSYYLPEIGLYVNGENNQGEVLADNGGIKEAYLAYKRWVARTGDPGDTLPGIDLNHDQLFFLNFAQMWCGLHRRENLEYIVRTKLHPPERIRVIGTLSNSEHFAEAYQCKKGSDMVRDKPCQLW